jgi:geranylgeranyl pyrophosphate synthase
MMMVVMMRMRMMMMTMMSVLQLVGGEMASLSEGIKRLLGSDHPVLEACAKYFFELDGGKKIRPTMVLLISRAAQAHQQAMGTSVNDVLNHRDIQSIQQLRSSR